ncbi:MAG TPA: rubrerythrin family protein, partial [Spirochaetia bacterium]|nr:rubrerythrin family protein [Spirochaetia bacterium]
IISRIADDELSHYTKLKVITKTEVKPNKLRVLFYYVISRVFGLSFGLKLMERGEELASRSYSLHASHTRILKSLSLDEQKHEKALLDVLSEERLEYAGSIVLGLNDALVELTGALAGLTFALQDSRLIALAGMVTGFAASLSMAASGYLSSKEESDQNEKKNPLKAALYTGVAYIITVLLLIIPYFTPLNPFISLLVTLAIALSIIFLYTFYITTAKGLKFFSRFAEMAIISLVIAGISFFAGLGLKIFLGVDA